jgi:hypothetical protein
MLTRHRETTGVLNAPIERVFAHLDDHTRLSSHMTKSSWKMGGGRMEITTDAGHGQQIGSKLTLAGRAFGIRIVVEEVVSVREPPRAKTWETIGEPRLLVIGAYRMGFTLASRGEGTELCVAIDYDFPGRGIPRLLGRLFADAYARWCTRRMVFDATEHFGTASSPRVAAQMGSR